jgi:hypothetical protein
MEILSKWNTSRLSGECASAPQSRQSASSKPADIPVGQPAKYDLVINLTAGKALELTIPESFLLRRQVD